MLSRVDYTLGVVLAGLLTGVLIGRRFQMPLPSLAKSYYNAVLILLVPNMVLNMAILVFGTWNGWQVLGVIVGTAGGLIFGGVFGVMIGRPDGSALLEQPPVLAALRIGVAFTFVLAGIGKAFNMPYMIGFFAQSGYPEAFLKFVMVGESTAGVALLTDWFFLPALICLTIDMFGAIATHVHNGDPLDDSTGAINMVLRLAAIGGIWAFSSKFARTEANRAFHLGAVFVVMLACAAVAVAGGIGIRHFGPAH